MKDKKVMKTIPFLLKVMTVTLLVVGLMTSCSQRKTHEDIFPDSNIENKDTQTGNTSADTSDRDIDSGEDSHGETEIMKKELILKIDDIETKVRWEDNESVAALMDLAKDGLIIEMSMYGGFEQVGDIGSVLPSDDMRITTSPGDIVLYSSSRIVIFYSSNTWSYTKLGHLELTEELSGLLSEGNVTLTLTVR